MTRRTLLAAGGAGAVTLVGGGLIRTSGATVRASAPVMPVRSMFKPHVGSSFTLVAEDGRRVATRLVSIGDLRHGAREDENAFELLLHGSGDDRLEQAIARLEHRVARPTIPLLVSPAGTGARGQDYAIVVNSHPSTRV